MIKNLMYLITLVSAICLGTANAAERYSIGTGGTGGLFYVIGAGIANTLNNHLDGTTTRAEVTGASVENNFRVSSNQMTMGLSSSSTLFEAKNGQGPFKDKGFLDVEAIAYLYPAVLQIATIDGTGVKSFEDLKGKRVSMGPPGGNASVIATRLLQEYDVFDKITPRYLSYTEGVKALINGQVDAAVVLAGAPTASLIDLDSQEQMRLLSADPAKLANLEKKYPFYQTYSLPAGTYPDQKEATIVLNDPAVLFTNGKESEETIYNITKALFTNLDELGRVHPLAAGVTVKQAPNTPIALHPGAKKYYIEAGVAY